jgi:hypothetical protein
LKEVGISVKYHFQLRLLLALKDEINFLRAVNNEDCGVFFGEFW